jgi:hypothetical protein
MAGKPKKTRQKVTAAEVAKRAGCSRQLASRLLLRGFSEAEIVRRCADRKERQQARAARIAGATGNGSGGYVNGHSHDSTTGEFPFPTVPIPPFAHSEARKEHFLASIREAQAAKLTGQLLPLQPWRGVVLAATQHVRNRLRDLPGELADELGPELANTLRAKIHAIFDESRRIMTWEFARVGIQMPPDPPAPVRSRLAYYEAYLAGSRTGEIENIDTAQQIGTPEWFARHPSIDFQESFRYSRLKKEWDADMSELLGRRAAWDLPSELPDAPPGTPEDM